jgi:para-aminobenzoate synthetase component 1
VRLIKISAERLVRSLLGLSESNAVCILDSCGVGHLGSHLLVAGVRPIRTLEFRGDARSAMAELEKEIRDNTTVTFFTLSYEFGSELLGLRPVQDNEEPMVFAASFDCIVVHDYRSGETFLTGNESKFDEVEVLIREISFEVSVPAEPVELASNFTRTSYVAAIDEIQEYIRNGDTYQTNLTQQITATLPAATRASDVFYRLRRDHPAPFSAFMVRDDSVIVSASPERFFRVNADRTIEASPIKGTRRRGETREEDDRLRAELIASPKDRAENTMIVDLLRNDLGRVCEFGSVSVEKLCDLEEHPTLFHLVSTINGTLRRSTNVADIIEALHPCGSITGAPKISTMELIAEIEKQPRGLSMGAIGYAVPEGFAGLESGIDASVAIRTMVVRDGVATFNVGGGIVIDSHPNSEYDESLLKSKALLAALGSKDYGNI